ncbi:MAG: hypothetical protein RhofKO_32320 [Rhodothermales bacterium]
MPYSDPPRRPFVRPFSHTLNQLGSHEALRPSQLMDQARALLEQRAGSSSASVSTGSAPIPHPLLTDHVRHADGLALVLMRSSGVGIAVRPADTTRVFFDASAAYGEDSAFDTLRERIAHVLQAKNITADVALVHAHVPQTLEYETLGIVAALHEALAIPPAQPPSSASGDVQALTLALTVGAARDVVLVDTERREAIVVPPNAESQAVRWGLVTAPPTRPASRLTSMDAPRLLKRLQQATMFARLSTLRALEHRDLETAIDEVPRSLQGALRYWVTEGSRVQKMTVALRKGDWQMVGALMLMADASRRNDADARDGAATALIDHLETLAQPELYGALPTRPGQLLVLGQAYALPKTLGQLQNDRADVQTVLL